MPDTKPTSFSSLTPTQINALIAVECGICTHPEEKRRWVDGGEESSDYEICECGASETMGGSLKLSNSIPSYFTDLNACAERQGFGVEEIIKLLVQRIERLETNE